MVHVAILHLSKKVSIFLTLINEFDTFRMIKLRKISLKNLIFEWTVDSPLKMRKNCILFNRNEYCDEFYFKNIDDMTYLLHLETDYSGIDTCFVSWISSYSETHDLYVIGLQNACGLQVICYKIISFTLNVIVLFLINTNN